MFSSLIWLSIFTDSVMDRIFYTDFFPVYRIQGTVKHISEVLCY